MSAEASFACEGGGTKCRREARSRRRRAKLAPSTAAAVPLPRKRWRLWERNPIVSASSFSFFVPFVSYFLFCVLCSAMGGNEHEMRQHDGKTLSLIRLRGRGTASAVGGAKFVLRRRIFFVSVIFHVFMSFLFSFCPYTAGTGEYAT